MTTYLSLQQIQKLQQSSDSQQFSNLLLQLLGKDTAMVMFTKSLYAFCTNQRFSCQQKQMLINTSLNLLSKIPHHKTQKIAFVEQLTAKVLKLSSRKRSEFASQFSQNQCSASVDFLIDKIMPYYEFYQCSLEKIPKFGIQCSIFNPIDSINQNPIVKGKVVQVQTLDFLKEFVGQRAPKQVKIDPKKK